MILTRAFALGQRVFDRTDPRHVGVVIAFSIGHVKVRWEETNWVSEVPTCNLETSDE